MREFLSQTSAFMPPAQALEDLSPEDAAHRVPGATHSVAELVAHLDFWQAWFIKRCRGTGEPLPAPAAVGWPAAGASEWDAVRERFLDGIEQLSTLAETPDLIDQPIAPAIEFPALAHYRVRDALVHVATHNAHHLGQVVTLRQLAGHWPPPAGSWTW